MGYRSAYVLAVLALTVTPAPAADCDPAFAPWTNQTFADHVRSLARGPGSALWAGTNGGGVLRFDTDTVAFDKFTRVGDCLPDNFIHDVDVDTATGDVWVATDKGVGHRPGDASPGDPWTVFDSANSPLGSDLIRAVAVDHDGTLWIGTYDAGLYHYDGVDWVNFTAVNSGLSDDFVTSIVVDPAGNKWIGVWGDGVDRFDGLTWTNFDVSNTQPPMPCQRSCSLQLTCPPATMGLMSNFVRVLAADAVTGDLWLRNDDDGPCGLNGLTRYDGASWNTFTEQNSGLISNAVEGATVAASGLNWFVTPLGASSFDGTRWTDYPLAAGDAVLALGSDVWFGTGDGLLRWDGVRPEHFRPEGLEDNLVSGLDVEPATGDVWFGTRTALHRFDGTTWQDFDQTNTPLTSADFRAVLVAADGTLWVGLQSGGAAHYDGSDWTQWDPNNSGICCFTINALVEDAQGRIWAGYDLGGLSRWDGAGWTDINQGNSGLPSTFIRDMERVLNDDLWFATNLGATRFDGTLWTTFDQQDGLPSSSVHAVGGHPGGDVWIGTTQGVSRFDGAAFHGQPPVGDDYIRTITADAEGRMWVGARNGGMGRFDGAWDYFDVEDGLVFGRPVVSAADPAGPLWIGTEFGASAFDDAGPGAVPDGNTVTGTPLTVDKGPGPGELTLSWGASCRATAQDYGVYRGVLGDFQSHEPLTCGTGGALSFTIAIQPGDAYYLVTPLGAASEGSYGLDSGSTERTPPASVCFGQVLSACD